MEKIIAYIIMVCSVIVASFSQVLLKKSSNKQHKNIINEYLNWKVICGYGLLFLSTILTIFAFRSISFTSGVIIESLGYIFIMFLSRFFFKEKITINKIIGNLLIIFGIIIFYNFLGA